MDTPALNPAHSRTVLVNGKRIYLLKVARGQRTLILLVLAVLACYLGAMMVFPFTESIGMSRADAYPLITAAITLSFILILLGIVQTIRLAVAASENVVVATFCGFLMLIPLVGPLVLLVVNTNATALLQKNGVTVGFFGVTKDQMRKLVLGACPACGYDIRGLPAPKCPECGTPLAAEAKHAEAFNPGDLS